MISAAPHQVDDAYLPLMVGDFVAATDNPPPQKSPGEYIQEAKVLLSHGDAGKALDVILKCNQKFLDLPEWQQLDLRELTAKLFDQMETIISPEEWRYRKRQMVGTGLAPTEITGANSNHRPMELAS